MLELGVGADILRGVGALIWISFFAAVAFALWKGKTPTRKAIYVALIFGLFFGPMIPGFYESWNYKQRYAKAKELFDERCKTAGERIYRTAQSVDTLVWQRWRPKDVNEDDQFSLHDPYGRDCRMEGCILQLLRGVDGVEASGSKLAKGYKFVETVDPRDGVRYAYSGVFKNIRNVPKEELERHVEATGYGVESDGQFLTISRKPIDSFGARYGVVWDDVSTPEDRKYWIAGGSIRIIDLRTSEVIAERTGYLMDPGQGSTGGFRSPWIWARSATQACPSIKEHNFQFIRSVLNVE